MKRSHRCSDTRQLPDKGEGRLTDLVLLRFAVHTCTESSFAHPRLTEHACQLYLSKAGEVYSLRRHRGERSLVMLKSHSSGQRVCVEHGGKSSLLLSLYARENHAAAGARGVWEPHLQPRHGSHPSFSCSCPGAGGSCLHLGPSRRTKNPMDMRQITRRKSSLIACVREFTQTWTQQTTGIPYSLGNMMWGLRGPPGEDGRKLGGGWRTHEACCADRLLR